MLNFVLAVFYFVFWAPRLCYSISQIDPIPSINLPPQILYPAQIHHLSINRYKNPFPSQSHLHDEFREAKLNKRQENPAE
jgi:hypothetical protein